jgi:subtilisin family serine protease
MRRTWIPVLAPLLAFSTLAGAGAATASAAPASQFGDYIVVLKSTVDPAAAAQTATRDHGAVVGHIYRSALRGFAATIPTARVAALRANPNIVSVVDDAISVTNADQFPPPPATQPAQAVSNGVNRVDGDLSSTRSGDGGGSVNVNVAVLDSGIDPSHPDLNVAGGVDCANGQGFDDKEGHGTMVAGFIGALDNAIGRVGIAPGARLWSVRITGKQGYFPNSDLLCGIDWVTSTRNDSDPNNDISVANLSGGGPSKKPDDGNCGYRTKDVVHQAVCASVAAGVTYVVAAANDATDTQSVYPATYSEVLTVTAMADTDGQSGGLGPNTQCFVGARDDEAASFSNFATLAADKAHTVAAPGVCNNSTYPNANYATSTGTSFASPIVAGTVALCIASGPCARLTPAQIVQKIVADAAAYNTANPGYGFSGDPQRPVAGKYYGYLVRAAAY